MAYDLFPRHPPPAPPPAAHTHSLDYCNVFSVHSFTWDVSISCLHFLGMGLEFASVSLCYHFILLTQVYQLDLQN